jgi:hypothetical protein
MIGHAPQRTPQPAEGGHTATALGRWIHHHDDSRLFAILYIGLALVLSIVLGLFWLVVVVALHGLLEVVRQRSLDPWWPGVLGRVLWELKLDLALILLAFVVVLYMDVVLGVAGLNAAVRAGARGGARLLAWQRGLRAAALSIDDVAQIARAAASRRRGGGDGGSRDDAATASKLPTTSGWTAPWSRGDRVAVGLGAVCLGLVLAAPWLTGQPPAAVWAQIVAELRPFPE